MLWDRFPFLALVLLALASGPWPAAATTLPATPQLPFEEIAQRGLAAHGQELSSPEEFDLPAFFVRHYPTIDLGLYELAAPAHRLGDRRWAQTFADVATALLDAQTHWLTRADPAQSVSKEARADIAILRRWTSKWTPAEISRAAAGEERALLLALEPKEDVVQASARLRALMLGSLGLPGGRTLEQPIRLVLAPTRTDFVELLALVGFVKPDLRSIFWQPGVDEWLEFSVDERKIIALEYIANGREPGDYASSTPMDERTPTGIQQQVVQFALLRLVDVYYEGGMPPELGKGLVMNLVVDQFGEIRTRVDGDLSANQTQKREVFVRGGASEGGRLPQSVAETRWRMDGGKDRYLRILRQVQRSGRSLREGSSNELARFQLQSRDESQRTVVSAPIFGSAAANVAAPPDYVHGDFLEFMRAYQCGFVHWLQEHGAGAKKSSEQAFAQLLAALADPANTASVEEIFVAIYGAPISDAECSPATLEGKFLRWLSTQR